MPRNALPTTSSTIGPSYPCWRCGAQILQGCTHHCGSAVPFQQTTTTIESTPAQRQDSLDDQLRDVAKVAEAMGCYDAADWIKRRRL